MLGFSGKVRKFNFVEVESESAAGRLRENPRPGTEIYFGPSVQVRIQKILVEGCSFKFG